MVSPTELEGRTCTDLSKADADLPFFTDILNLDDTLRFDLADCAFTAEVCIGVPLDDISDYQITINGAAYTNGIAGCDNDTTNLYSYTNLFGQGNLGPYILQSWQINTSVFSTPFNNIAELVDSMNSWDPLGNWILDETNKLITGGVPGNDYFDMDIYVLPINSNSIIGHNDNFIPRGTLLFINSGATEIIITESMTGDSDTTFVIASCAQPSTTVEQISVGGSETFCLDFGELPGDVSTVTNICPATDIGFQLINNDSCVQYSGLSVGQDTACLVACDIYGFCDTTYLIVNALQAMGSQAVFDTLLVGESAQWCANQSIFVGAVDTIYNICPDSSGTFASLSIDQDLFCVNYTGLSGLGNDVGCFVVCDDMNNCDTTYLNLTVRRSEPLYYFDTLYINQSGFFCDWDESNLFGPVVDIENGCPGSSGSEVFFDVDVTNICIGYEGIGIGKDTACIYLTDGTGAVDTTIAIICVLQPEASVISEVIRLTTSSTYCIDTTQLAGTITSIENICPGDSGQEIDFMIDSTTFCVTANPIAIGVDSACIVICDDFGICDTTSIIIEVSEDALLNKPIAVDDVDSTAQNTSLVIDACFNDTIPEGLDITNFFVLPVASGGIGPQNGTAFSNADCTVSYVPDDDYCGTDEITYIVCNMMGCDTATISVSVICPSADFKIFNAFSPNGDGVNEYFKINGIEQFPDHTLSVFNRWGNEVLKVSNYQNDWNARWNGLDLPDGTYFYVFDTGTGTVDSGYVYIGR